MGSGWAVVVDLDLEEPGELDWAVAADSVWVVEQG